MTTDEPNSAHLRVPLIKVPLEQSKRQFRREARFVDREIGSVLNSENPDILNRLQSLKSKLTECVDKARSQRNIMKTRLSWKYCADIKLYIGDFLLRLGKINAARTIEESNGELKDLLDLSLHEEVLKLANMLMERNSGECLEWCSEYRAQMKKGDSSIEFLIRRQEFVELCRARRLLEAVSYAKKHFPTFQGKFSRQIDQSMALLAVDPQSDVEPYCWLYDLERWNDLAKLFKAENITLNHLPSRPFLMSLMHAGLGSIKSPLCGHKKSEYGCPACVDPFSNISSDFPFAHYETSNLVCRVTGKQMNGNNEPMVLPNGQVYSRESVETILSRPGDMVECPVTKKKFKKTDVKKCYIL